MQGLLNSLQQGFQSPLFQSGAAMYNSASQGQNIGAGFMAGGEAAQKAQQAQFQQHKQQREQQSQQQRDQMWRELTSGGTPQWASKLPPGTFDLMRALGLDAGSQFASQMMMKNADRDLDIRKIDETRRYHDSVIGHQNEQRSDIRAMQPYRQDLLKAQAEAARRKDEAAEFQAQIMRQLMPGLQPGTPGPPPPVGQPIMPQSNEVEPQDPQLIQAQTSTPAGPVQPPVHAAGVIDTPYGKMTAEKARATAGAMMLVPHMAAAGKALFDSIPQSQLGKDTRNDVEKKQFNSQEALARLRSIDAQVRPEFLTIENRLGYAWTDLLSKFRTGQANVTPEQVSELSNFAAFRADSLNNLNNYIKEITGAAMTDSEAKRIIAAMPNPGEGIFDGDSPPVFMAKLKAVKTNMQLGIARYSYLRTQGFNGSVEEASKQISIERMSGIIQNRTSELLREMQSKNKGVGVDQLRPLIQQRLRAEFGISA